MDYRTVHQPSKHGIFGFVCNSVAKQRKISDTQIRCFDLTANYNFNLTANNKLTSNNFNLTSNNNLCFDHKTQILCCSRTTFVYHKALLKIPMHVFVFTVVFVRYFFFNTEIVNCVIIRLLSTELSRQQTCNIQYFSPLWVA